MALTGHWRLTGEVLAAERPCQLSYTLDDPPGSPSVYVTWELRGTGEGTIIRLNVDEPWPLADSREDLESAWLPVLSGLVNTSNGARLHPQRGHGETGRKAATTAAPSRAGPTCPSPAARCRPDGCATAGARGALLSRGCCRRGAPPLAPP